MEKITSEEAKKAVKDLHCMQCDHKDAHDWCRERCAMGQMVQTIAEYEKSQIPEGYVKKSTIIERLRKEQKTATSDDDWLTAFAIGKCITTIKETHDSLSEEKQMAFEGVKNEKYCSPEFCEYCLDLDDRKKCRAEGDVHGCGNAIINYLSQYM